MIMRRLVADFNLPNDTTAELSHLGERLRSRVVAPAVIFSGMGQGPNEDRPTRERRLRQLAKHQSGRDYLAHLLRDYAVDPKGLTITQMIEAILKHEFAE